ncbi:MAG: trypsin-like peptidase domain-containing protein [Patescibacteria group bacterium]
MTQSRSPIKSAIKKVMPAVVSIAITKSLQSIEKEIPADLAPLLPFQDGHLKIPDEMADGKGMVKIGGGSGFLVDASGVIVTNKHVVTDPQAEYTVILNGGERFHAEVLARDPMDDVAILKIESKKKLPFVKLGTSDGLELGESVVAIGNALGIFRNTVSSGIISGLSRSIRAATEVEKQPAIQELRGLIQTDAAINPGNSGGPLVNLKGEAIGINAAIVFGAQNLGFAIPINAVKRDLADLKKYGRIRRPLLGLRYMMLDEHLREKFGAARSVGAFIIGQMPHAQAIIPGSPADKAGIKERDIIIAINGQKLTEDKTIQDFLEEAEVGNNLEMTVVRGEKEFRANAMLTERK